MRTVKNVEEVKDTTDYGALYVPEGDVRIIKKDGSYEPFNMNKVVSAVGGLYMNLLSMRRNIYVNLSKPG